MPGWKLASLTVIVCHSWNLPWWGGTGVLGVGQAPAPRHRGGEGLPGQGAAVGEGQRRQGQ